MQPLIRLRSLASQLKPDELKHLMQKVIATYDANQILTFIFNHFVLKYNQSNEHGTDVFQIIQMISTILNVRKKNKRNTKNENNNNLLINREHKSVQTSFKRYLKRTKIVIDSLPYDLIGECASFLEFDDYICFSKCNRKTYIGCYSPATLQKLTMGNDSMFTAARDFDLNRFPLLTSLASSVEVLNDYSVLHPQQKTLDNLHTLSLFGSFDNDHQTIQTFTGTKWINFKNITHLKCSGFGFGDDLDVGIGLSAAFPYSFNSFLDFLSSFRNLKALSLDDITLSEFDEENDVNFDRFPNLRSLSVDASQVLSPALRVLAKKLFETYAKQLISIRYIPYEYDAIYTEVTFPQLKSAEFNNQNMVSVLKIINNAPHLERLDYAADMEHDEDNMFNVANIKTMIRILFAKCVYWEYLYISAHHFKIGAIMDCMTIALLNGKNIAQEQMTLVLCTNAQMCDEGINEMHVHISRLITAFALSKIDDFMFGFHFVESTETKPFDRYMDKYKDQYLVNVRNECRSMIISNKTCKINGYTSRWDETE
eukprot:1011088_1